MPMIMFPPRDEFLESNPNVVRNFKRHIAFGDFRTNACWRWTGAPSGSGRYGQFTVHIPGRDRGPVKAHRLALVLQGYDLGEREVSHICRLGLCVNPSHLVPWGHDIHREADAYAREQRQGMPMGAAEPILHKRLWEGWELEEYNAIARPLDREIVVLAHMIQDGQVNEAQA
jgi:hypothetical protein